MCILAADEVMNPAEIILEFAVPQLYVNPSFDLLITPFAKSIILVQERQHFGSNL